MKAAILGGSFNPIHKGHLALAESVLNLLDYDKIILIPTFLPHHKEHYDLVDSVQRLEMVQLATENFLDIIVSDCEIRREGPSYTIDTVKYLIGNYSFEDKPGLIIGDDWVKGFSRWKNVDELVSLVNLIMARRELKSCGFNYPYIPLDNDIVSISSTEIRAKIKKGEDIRPFVPAKVADYIDSHGLYRNN